MLSVSPFERVRVPIMIISLTTTLFHILLSHQQVGTVAFTATTTATAITTRTGIQPSLHPAWIRKTLSSSSSSIITTTTHQQPYIGPLHLMMDDMDALNDNDNEDDGDDDDEEDEDEIDLSDRDWRAFRAQLVMSKPKSESDTESSSSTTTSSSNDDTTTTTTTNTNIYDDDLDGIGSLFTDDSTFSTTTSTSSTSSSSSSSSTNTNTAMSESNFTPLDPSQWAYESGNVIEKGAVILGGVDQIYGFGLRQQYFHKSVILVLDHSPTFTRGIILNRPSDMVLMQDVTINDEDGNGGDGSDSSGEPIQWRVWFGGDVQGLGSVLPPPEIIAMHSIKDDEDVDAVSTELMNDIKWMSFKDAQKLVAQNKAKVNDFWVFAGYAGWGPNQLMGELDRKSWYMAATSSQTLLQELAKQSSYTDPRDAGIDTWDLLMNMIGKGDTAEDCAGSFEDLMLKEWAREDLLSVEAGGNAGNKIQPALGVATTKELKKTDPMERLMKRAKDASRGEDVTVGTLVRASSADRSPFLLANQEYHKSIVLIISDDDNVSVGLILNQPAKKGLDMELVDKNTFDKRVISIPIRFGGNYAVKGQSPLLWLHCNSKLRAAKVGSPVGLDSDAEIWKCTQEDAVNAIGNNIARPSDFFIVTGLSIWTKGEKGIARGMEGEVKSGRFEVIPKEQIPDVWRCLKRQEVLSKINLLQNVGHGFDAWEAGAVDIDDSDSKKSDNDDVIDGIGEGYDEEDDSMVFKSNTTVAKLSDDALRTWVATFLLGAPSLGA